MALEQGDYKQSEFYFTKAKSYKAYDWERLIAFRKLMQIVERRGAPAGSRGLGDEHPGVELVEDREPGRPSSGHGSAES